MKKHIHLIRLIVITAGLIGLAILAFKYLHSNNENTQNITIQSKLHTSNDLDDKRA